MQTIKSRIHFIKLVVSAAVVFVAFLTVLSSALAAQTEKIHLIQPSQPPNKLAVTEPGYDDIKIILDRLGYKTTEIKYKDLANFEYIKQFSAIYINCAAEIEDEELNGGNKKIYDSIKQYVAEGGNIYASDWASFLMEGAFPGQINFYTQVMQDGEVSTLIGDMGVYTADIVDKGLQEVFGKHTAKINFDTGVQVIIDSVGEGTRVYIQGQMNTMPCYEEYGGSCKGAVMIAEKLYDKPYVVSFPYGKGQVLFTTFHNEAQNTGDVDKLLNWFAVKTKAGKLGQATNTLAGKNKILQEIVDSINQNETKSYDFEAIGEAAFSIVLNFGGSAIEMTVTDPDGEKILSENIANPPFTYEIREAKKGLYAVSLTGTEIPEKNYPFVLVFSGNENGTGEITDNTALDKSKNTSKTIFTLVAVLVVLAGGAVLFVIQRKK